MLKDIFNLAGPLVVGQLSFALMGLIDTLLMGRLGVDVLAGGGLGAVVYQFFYIVGIGALVATANMIAFAKGQEDYKEVHRAVLSGALLVIILFVAFGVSLANMSPVLLYFGQVPDLVGYAQSYLDVVVWALLPAFGFILMRSLVVGLGSSKLILPISLLAAALNYPVSLVFMEGYLGFPKMGLEGVALGTFVISWAMFLGIVMLSYRKDLYKKFPFWKGWRSFEGRQFKETLKLGVPIALAHAMEVGMFTAAAVLIGWLGANALAAHHVALQATTLSFMIPLGISQAVSVKVGELYGQGNITKIPKALAAGAFLAALSAATAASLFIFAPESIVQLFVHKEQVSLEGYEQFFRLVASILVVAALFQFVDGWQVICMGALRGFKLGTSPTVVAVVSYWFVGIPLSFLLLDSKGALGVWIGMGVGLAVSGIVLSMLLYREVKKRSQQWTSHSIS
jgi:MATE family multidrug resistance protein